MYLISLISPFSPTTISLATVRSQNVTPVFLASFSVMVGSYFAWIGQIGMQLVLPAQARRFRYGSELRAAGNPLTGIMGTGLPIPKNPVSASVSGFWFRDLLTYWSVVEFGIFGIGYGSSNSIPPNVCSSISPETPSSFSASL